MIFNNELREKTPKACEYFEKIFVKNMSKLSPSIILYGDNSDLTYDFATEIARALNCERNKEFDCECLNCRWIRENKHPEVKTYSNLENKSDNKKTVISIEQIKNLLEEISLPSDYKRVYIFCAASENKEEEACEGKKVVHLPLTRKILTSEASNALLKSIEEPPSNTFFIFIARDKEDILPTIISRSQSFYIHSKQADLAQIEGLEDIFRYYPFNDYTSAKESIEALVKWQNDNNFDIYETINYVQDYLKQILYENLENRVITNAITADIFKFEEAKNMAKSFIKDNIIYENLTYKLYKD